MKSKRLAVAVLITVTAAAAAAGAIWYTHRDQGGKLVLSGSIEERSVEVGSLVGGRVARVHVDEGARVRAGQPIVTFEPDLVDLQITQQRAQVAGMEAALAKAVRGPRSEELARARIDSQTSETDRARLEHLWKTGVIPRQQYDAAVAKAATALETFREAERGNRPEDIAAARADLDRERQHLAYLERQRQELVVTAPADGVVESMDLRPGDLLAANQSVATLLEPDQIWVRVFVPETQMGLVRVGQEAAVTVDTFPRRAFHGRVVEIRSQGEYTPRNLQTLDQRSDQVFGVKVRIDPAPELKAGMAAIVHLQPGGTAAPEGARS
jgi:multidrug resistance efflux pump